MINSKQIKDFMDLGKSTLESGDPVNVCFSGAPGLGKSALVEAWAKGNGYKYLDVRLAQMEAPDVRGIQREIPGTMRLQYLLPSMWPESGKVVINLDELNRAPRSNMNAILSLLQERRIGELNISPEAIIVACINEGPEYDVNEMDPAVKDRLLMVQVDYDHSAFLEYAKAKEFHPHILGFLQSGLWVYRTPAQLGEKKYMANRSWTRLNSAYRNASEALKSKIISIELGPDLGKTFQAWIADNKPLVLKNFTDNEKEAFTQLKALGHRQDLLATLVLDMGTVKAGALLPLYGRICEALPMDLVVQVHYAQLVKHDQDILKEDESPEQYLKKVYSIPLFSETQKGFREKVIAAVKASDEAAGRGQ